METGRLAALTTNTTQSWHKGREEEERSDGELFGGEEKVNVESGGRLVRIYDPEVGMRDNPAENKHRRLVRSHRAGVLDRDLKPNAKIRDELNVSFADEDMLSPAKFRSCHSAFPGWCGVRDH